MLALDWTHITGDVARGLRVSPEDMAIAALVVMPFALALVLLVNAMAWWPSALMIGLFVVATGAGTLWNAGWRARTFVADSGNRSKDRFAVDRAARRLGRE